MKKIILVALLALSLTGCDRQDKPVSPPPPVNPQAQVTPGIDNDNTGKNVRDRDAATKTPLDQSGSEADRTITQKIRQLIIADDTLSTNAKNIKIITINGVVTLRGPVANANEKANIEKKAAGVQGIKSVDNQLEITRS